MLCREQFLMNGLPGEYSSSGFFLLFCFGSVQLCSVSFGLFQFLSDRLTLNQNEQLFMRRIRLSDFMPLYNAISGKKSKLPVRILRRFKQEFYAAFRDGKMNVSELARVCGISRPTAYKYLKMMG